MDNQQKIDEIKKHGITKQGRNELIQYLEGKRMTMRQLVKAKCYECMGYYADGGNDCETPFCPLYPYHPYNANKQKGTRRGGFGGKVAVSPTGEGIGG